MNQAFITGGIPLVCNLSGNKIKIVSKAYHKPFSDAIFGFVMRYFESLVLFPLNSPAGLGREVVKHPVDAGHF